MNEGSSRQSFSFPSLSNRSNSSRHERSIELNSEASRKDPDLRKDPGSSFALLNLCAKFQDNISTRSTLTRADKRPPNRHIWTGLLMELSKNCLKIFLKFKSQQILTLKLAVRIPTIFLQGSALNKNQSL